jgi:hypothetical protein
MSDIENRKNKMNCELMLTYDTPALTHWTCMHIFRHIFLSNYWWQRSDIWSQASYRYPISWEVNLMGPKTLPTIWGTYMKLVTKYQISAIKSCWEKCDEKCAYMFNVHKKFAEERGYHKWALAHSSTCCFCFYFWHIYMLMYNCGHIWHKKWVTHNMTFSYF